MSADGFDAIREAAVAWWQCGCGHSTEVHSRFWDADSDSGFACSQCRCMNPWDPEPWEPF